jgi:hypothetical protein
MANIADHPRMTCSKDHARKSRVTFALVQPRSYNQVIECPLVAQSGHGDRAQPCPLLGVKRTSAAANPMSAFDPKRTLAANFAAMHAFNLLDRPYFLSPVSNKPTLDVTRLVPFLFAFQVSFDTIQQA